MAGEHITITQEEYEQLQQIKSRMQDMERKIEVVRNFIKGVQDAQRPNRLSELVEQSMEVLRQIH